MAKVYGQEACEVVQPDGLVTPYVIAPAPAPAGCWRCFRVTSPDGKTYRVTEYPDGRFDCECPWWVHRGRYKPLEDGLPCDKHIRGVLEWLKEQPAEVPPDASSEPTTVG